MAHGDELCVEMIHELGGWLLLELDILQDRIMDRIGLDTRRRILIR
jgi:hypothetical protein